ncbi:hypothetical protein C8J56DRAFT_896306 [Mycena floridula]|nr:hypothetical protein C8J56DRAFT_896306 [Mycena floridula]
MLGITESRPELYGFNLLFGLTEDPRVSAVLDTSFAASKSSEASGAVEGGRREVRDLMAEDATGITDALSIAISQLQTISKQDGRPRSSDAPISRLICRWCFFYTTSSMTIGRHLSAAAVASASTTFLECARNSPTSKLMQDLEKLDVRNA